MALAHFGRKTLVLLSLLVAPASAAARAETSQTVLFYLHGAIVEGRASGVEHPAFGPYDVDGIVRRFRELGYEVVTEVRPQGTRVDDYAARLASQVEARLADGERAEDLVVMGHSKGGRIAREVARLVGRDDLRFVVLAGCFPSTGEPRIPPRGRFLSVLEKTDEVAVSCLDGSLEPARTKEVVLDVGGGHGLFYRPESSWVKAVDDWLRTASP